MDKEHPLPRDMRWKADDPRWDDPGVVTAWDRFVTAAVKHFEGKPVILQLANEPGHDKWKNGYIDEYVKFMTRTARLIKKTDPQAKVSLNNVYTHASRVNHALLKARGLADIDVWSWHDYHAGRLLDEKRLKRMRSMLDSAGGEHLEIWFTEGWAYTNTRVDEPIAGIVFIAPESGMYRATGTASGKPWTGGAKFHRLSVRKKDTQRAPEIRQIKLPRDNRPVPFDFTVELSKEHELVILPLMPDWNNGCNIRIDGLTVTRSND
jgi:hypothetical protein